jgi:hypothetical protein
MVAKMDEKHARRDQKTNGAKNKNEKKKARSEIPFQFREAKSKF